MHDMVHAVYLGKKHMYLIQTICVDAFSLVNNECSKERWYDWRQLDNHMMGRVNRGLCPRGEGPRIAIQATSRCNTPRTILLTNTFYFLYVTHIVKYTLKNVCGVKSFSDDVEFDLHPSTRRAHRRLQMHFQKYMNRDIYMLIFCASYRNQVWT